MSLILDALRKADRERQSTQQVPGLDAQHDLPVASSPSVLLKWLAVSVAVLVLMLLVWWWLAPIEQSPLPITQEPLPVKQNPLSSGRIDSNTTADEQKTVSTLPVNTTTPEAAVVAVDNTLPELLGGVEEAAEIQSDIEPVANKPRQFDTHYQGVAKTEALDAPVVESEEIQQLYQQPAVMGAVAAEPEKVEANLPAVGGVRDLPLSVQNRVPTLMYAAHSYQQEDRPSVIINGQRLHKGSTISGMTVEDIHVDGVVLRLDGHRFKLNALSSWVNM